MDNETATEIFTTDQRTELFKGWAPDAKTQETFDALDNEKQHLYNHCETENTKVEDEALPVKLQKEQLDESTKRNLEECNRLLTEMGNEIEKVKSLENERNQLNTQHRDLLCKLDNDQSKLDRHELKSIECADDIDESSKEHERLKQETQQLQQHLDDMNRKENENIEQQNYLQLSLNGLQAIIKRTQQELQEQLQYLSEEQVQLKETEDKIELLKEQLKQMETKMKQIQRDLERLKDEQTQLTLKQQDLQQQQKQWEKVIDQLQLSLKQKDAGLLQMLLDIEIFNEKIKTLNQQLETLGYVAALHFYRKKSVLSSF
jgi:chromosome segregation ATPase